MNINECRIAYFGTWGTPGHLFRVIRGTFTKRERDAMSNIDMPVFHDAMNQKKYLYVTFERFMGYAIPVSMDDKRPGCVSAIFVEGAESPNDIREIINNADNMLKSRFITRLPKSSDQ